MAGKQAESTLAPPMAGQSSSTDGRPSFLPSRIRPAPEKLPYSTSRGNADRRDRLPAALSAGIASLTGVDLAATKVYRSSPEPSKYNALAFASKGSIHLAAGQDKHLPHEAWHLVQQAQNRVKVDSRIGNVGLNADQRLESEADRMGPAAFKLGHSAAGRGQRSLVGRVPGTDSQPVLQRVVFTRAQTTEARALIAKYRDQKNTDGLRTALLKAGYSESVLLDLVSTLFFAEYYDEGSFLARSLDSELSLDEIGSLAGVDQSFADDANLAATVNTAEERLNNQLHDGNLEAGTGDVDQETTKLLNKNPDPDFVDKDAVTQMKRSPGKDSGPKYYKNSKGKDLDGIGYTTDEKGSIDFNKPWKDTAGAKAPPSFQSNVAKSTVDLKKTKNKEQIPIQGGKAVHIKNATRAQHFSVANRILFGKATENHKGLTWHHLTEKYKMVLVDAKVHAKHGHNGGFLLWK
jgi:hypothetical protein